MNTKEKLNQLKSHESNLFVIHYSCQNIGDKNDGLSPRITSIAVLHYESSSMHSFSIHLIAEENNIEKDRIPENYDKLEKIMLENFYSFVSTNEDGFWLHWNMTNINFGFEALEHRYKVLSDNNIPTITDSHKFNLSSLILSVYGNKCVDDPKMPNLMNLNGGAHRDTLPGKDEVSAFEKKEYVKLHKSTMSKVYWLKSMYNLLKKRKVITQRSNWSHKLNSFLEMPLVKFLGFIAVLHSLYQILSPVFQQAPKLVDEKMNINQSGSIKKP